MSYNVNDLKQIYESFQKATSKSDNEEDLKIAIESALKQFFEKYGITIEPKYEKSVFRGRIDALYGFLIVEYESPKAMDGISVRNHAISQVKDYINKLAKEIKVKKESLFGIALDGKNIIYIRWRDNWIISRMYEINLRSMPQLLEFFRGLYREPLTSKSLTRFLGITSDICKKMMKELIKCLKNRKVIHTEILFNEWKKFYNESCGYDFKNPKIKLINFAKKFGLTKNETAECIFCLQTYFSLILTLLASEIVSLRTVAAFEGYLEYLLNCSKDELKRNFDNMIEGGIFENLGINNFLEGDFFWWFTEEWTLTLEESIINALERLNKYEPASSSVYEGNIEDVLKELYEDLIPREIRHDLGEFYTPNWIAEYIINNININKDTRILDPTCGSGTFLIQSIHKYINKFSSTIEESELLDRITKSFKGIDLNPIATITARTNYLLAIKELISFSKGSIFIPIYLSDSIASTKQRTLVGDTYIMSTTVGNFDIPNVFIESNHRLIFFQILEECIKLECNFNEFRDRLKKYFPEDQLQYLRNLYQKFLELEKEGKNRIWTRLLVNIFAPFTIGKFDYIIGNPPWIAWENLPKGYRKNTQNLWKKYYLFSLKSGTEAQLGGGKKDIAMLFVHRCIDFYLKEGGELIFLITQTVFQSVKTGEGFRKFRISAKEFFNVWKVDDINKLKAFHATNKAAIIYCKKGEKTEYPINYNIWSKKEKVNLTDNSLLYKDVKSKVKLEKFLAMPSSKKTGSPWAIFSAANKKFPELVKKYSGSSPYLGKAGVTTWMNGVYYVKILQTYPDGKILIENLNTIGKKKVQLVRAKIEPDLVYPLIRGRDVGIWELNHTDNIYIIITNDPATRKAIPLSRMKVEYPKTYNYLLKFKEVLITRSGYKKYFRSKGPFYAIYNVEKRLFYPYRIFWSEMGEFGCVVVQKINDQYLGEKLPMTNNKNMYIPFNDENKAYFVASIMNYSEVRDFIQTKKLQTSTTTKLISEMKIPRYNHSNPTHQKVVALAKKINNNKDKLKKDLNLLQNLISEVVGK